jgi:hypothetical protein
MKARAEWCAIHAAAGAMDQDADMPRIDVRDSRGQEHEQHDERGRGEQQPTDLRSEAGPTIAAHATTNGTEAIAD